MLPPVGCRNVRQEKIFISCRIWRRPSGSSPYTGQASIRRRGFRIGFCSAPGQPSAGCWSTLAVNSSTPSRPFCCSENFCIWRRVRFWWGGSPAAGRSTATGSRGVFTGAKLAIVIDRLRRNYLNQKQFVRAFHGWFDGLKSLRLLRRLCAGAPFAMGTAEEFVPEMLYRGHLAQEADLVLMLEILRNSQNNGELPDKGLSRTAAFM